MSNKCPVCESENLTTSKETLYVKAPFGEPEPYLVHNDKCLVCGEVGDFAEIYPDEYSRALEKSAKNSVPNLIQTLKSNDISRVRFERAFSLPHGEVKLWTEGNISHEALALLRCVATCPELIECAELNFKA